MKYFGIFIRETKQKWWNLLLMYFRITKGLSNVGGILHRSIFPQIQFIYSLRIKISGALWKPTSRYLRSVWRRRWTSTSDQADLAVHCSLNSHNKRFLRTSIKVVSVWIISMNAQSLSTRVYSNHVEVGVSEEHHHNVV